MTVQNFTQVSGEDISISLTFTKGNGSAQDITGWTIRLMIKEQVDDADADAKVNIDATIDDATGGLASFSIPDTTTSELSGTYYYEMRYEDSSNNIKPILTGKFLFKKKVIGSMA